MTRMHFRAIASAVRRTRELRELAYGPDLETADTLDAVTLELARELAQFNPNFNRARFLRACRGEAENG